MADMMRPIPKQKLTEEGLATTGGICSGGGTEVAVDFRFGHALASQPTYANYVAMCGDQ